MILGDELRRAGCLPVACGSTDDDEWLIVVDGREVWTRCVLSGDHAGPAEEQPIVRVNGRYYRVAMGWCYPITDGREIAEIIAQLRTRS